MTFTPKIATEDLFCFGCRNILGIPTPTIIPPADYYEASSEVAKEACCLDCFHRLKEEMEGSR